MKEKDTYIFAIETSCDETSCSIVKNGKEDIITVVNSQIDVHKLFGGVVPELASRMHLENITFVIDETLKKSGMKLEDMDAFACTYAPGLMGSLLVGLETTKTLSLVYNKPFIKVNHMMGHIYANNINNDLAYPLIALVVSGGHTDLILMENETSFKYLGSTLDDAVGESFDKVARILNLPYPGGPNVEKYAKEGTPSYKMPEIKTERKYDFSFSGLKSHCINLAHNEKQRGNKINEYDLACSFQNVVAKELTTKAKSALNDYNIKTLILCGGVAANNFIREELQKMCDSIGAKFFVPERKYCTDNAAMIGAAAYVLYKNEKFAEYSANAESYAVL